MNLPFPLPYAATPHLLRRFFYLFLSPKHPYKEKNFPPFLLFFFHLRLSGKKIKTPLTLHLTSFFSISPKKKSKKKKKHPPKRKKRIEKGI
jgi:hypothetical protein